MPYLPLYADYNASAPLKACVKEAMIQAMDLVGNPSSIHCFGRKVSAALEETRRLLATQVGAKPQDVIFTSGATEANNLILSSAKIQGFEVIVSAAEHDSIRSAALDAIFLPVTREGLTDPNALEAIFKKSQKRALVSLMAANNETGILQNLEEITNVCKVYEAALHVDGVQAFGKIPFSFEDSGWTSLTFSAHKIGGPSGVGALIVRPDFPLEPSVLGGGQEKGRRAGTPNILGIIGFGAAVQALAQDDWSRIQVLRDCFEEKLLKRTPEARIIGRNVARLPNTSCIVMPTIPADLLLMNFDLMGIAVSSGSACSSGKVKASHVLSAMGFSPDEAASALRFSFGPEFGAEELMRILDTWSILTQRLKRNSA